MDDVDQLFARLRDSAFTAMGADPNAIAYETQDSGVAPQGFLDSFQGPNLSLITGGVANAFFDTPPTTIAANIDNSVNIMPGWAFTQSSGTAVTAKYATDSAAGSGGIARLTLVSGAAGDAGYIEQVVSVAVDRTRGVSVLPIISLYCPSVGTAGSARINFKAQYLKADGVTTTGTEATGAVTLTTVNGSTDNKYAFQIVPNGTGAIPSDAGFVRLRAVLERDVALITAAGSIDIASIRLQSGTIQTLVTDSSDPATYGYGTMYQNGGAVYVAPSQGTHTGSAELVLDSGTAGNAYLIAGTSSGDVTLTPGITGRVVMSGALAAVGPVVLSSPITPTQLTVATNDWNPTGLSTANVIRMDASGALNLTGIAAQQAGRLIKLVNNSFFAVTLKNESASSTAANRFQTPGAADFALRQGGAVDLWYDSINSRWVVCGP